jgi:hypothetical protein
MPFKALALAILYLFNLFYFSFYLSKTFGRNFMFFHSQGRISWGVQRVQQGIARASHTCRQDKCIILFQRPPWKTALIIETLTAYGQRRLKNGRWGSSREDKQFERFVSFKIE